jgi:hypothetical protein
MLISALTTIMYIAVVAAYTNLIDIKIYDKQVSLFVPRPFS